MAKQNTKVTVAGSDIEIGAVELKDGTTDTRSVVSTAGADTVSNTQNELETSARISGFNGTTWDRIRTAVSAVVSSVTGILNVLPLGKYNTTPPVLTDGQFVSVQLDPAGNQKVTLATALAGEDIVVDVMKVEQRFSFQYISTATTTTIKSGAGFLHSIVVQGGTAGTIIVYDNTAASGTIIASFDSTNALQTYIFDCSTATGITIITSAATKLTANYR